MPHLERHPWRPGDATDILLKARIVGRAEGINQDGGRFHGLIVEPHAPVFQHVSACLAKPMTAEGHPAWGPGCTCPPVVTPQYVVFWVKGEFHVEPIALEGERFTCETCEIVGIVGIDGPLYGRDRDPRAASVGRCRNCTTQVD